MPSPIRYPVHQIRKPHLTPNEQRAWDMREKPISEVAVIMNILPRTVTQHLREAREKMREIEGMRA